MNDSISVNWGKLLGRILLYFVVSLICVIILYPYFVMVCTALKSRSEIFSINGTIFPIDVMWSNFSDIWQKAPMAKYMMNSIIIAGGSRGSAVQRMWLPCSSTAAIGTRRASAATPSR